MALKDWVKYFAGNPSPIANGYPLGRPDNELRSAIDRTPVGQPPGGAQAYISSYADTGREVTPETAREAPTVYACTRLISQSVARMEWRVMRRNSDGISEPAKDHPLYAILNVEANPYMGALIFRESMLLDCLLYGNAYAVIERDLTGRPKALHKLRADCVQVSRNEEGLPVYAHLSARYGRPEHIYQGYDIFHLRAPSLDGLLGETPIYLVRNIIAVELEAERFVASFFKNGARPAGIIKVAGTLTEEALKRLRQSWQAITGGAENAGRVAILESGYQWEKVSVDPEEAKLVELRGYCRSQIAAAFNVPVHMVGDATKVSYASAEQADGEFVKHCLGNWASRFEEEAARKLIRPGEGIETHISFDALLRGDLSTRFAAYSVALNNGFLTINEVRERENYAPVDGGNSVRAPVNLAVIDPDTFAANEPEGSEPIALVADNSATDPITFDGQAEVVADTALNGAQVTSLVELAVKVGTGELPKESAKALAMAAFPAIDPAIIAAIFDPLDAGSLKTEPAPDQAPMIRDARGRFMRKDQRLAELTPDESECVAAKIPILIEEGYQHDQAVAIAISKCRGENG